jgi:hypothetical protein
MLKIYIFLWIINGKFFTVENSKNIHKNSFKFDYKKMISMPWLISILSFIIINIIIRFYLSSRNKNNGFVDPKNLKETPNIFIIDSKKEDVNLDQGDNLSIKHDEIKEEPTEEEDPQLNISKLDLEKLQKISKFMGEENEILNKLFGMNIKKNESPSEKKSESIESQLMNSYKYIQEIKTATNDPLKNQLIKDFNQPLNFYKIIRIIYFVIQNNYESDLFKKIENFNQIKNLITEKYPELLKIEFLNEDGSRRFTKFKDVARAKPWDKNGYIKGIQNLQYKIRFF